MTAANSSKYRGFISYSHEDKAIATWLHRKLQSYQLPRRVANGSDRSLGKFFMDREGLSAAEDLTESLKTALGQSDALIIICSPAAAKSHWVAKEIDTFRELNPNGQILGVIAGGDPAQSSGDICPYPAPLMKDGREPLAADIRERGTERRLGFLKLVAALADTDPGELLQRDAVRRQQRVTLVTAASALIALTMSSLAVFAFNAQQEAQRRQAQAEGLVDFMLTDLRPRLEQIGRLDVLETVSDKVLNYYAENRSKLLPCDASIRKARALHIRNETLTSKNQFQRALGPAENARKIMREALRNCPDDPEVIKEASYAEAWATDPYFKRALSTEEDKSLNDGTGQRGQYIEDVQRALAGYRAMLDTAEQLKSIPGQEWQHTKDVVEARILIGKTLIRLDDNDGADMEFRAAETAILPYVPSNWETADDLSFDERDAARYYARVLLRSAEAYEQIAKYDTAYQNYLNAGVIYRKLALFRDWHLLRASLGTDLGRARMASKTGDHIHSNEITADLAPRVAELVAHDPKNEEWRQLQANVAALQNVD